MRLLARLIERALAAAAGVALFAMMALTFAEVVGRYFLDRPIAGGEDVKAFLLGITIFAALPLVTWRQRHIAVRSAQALLKGRALAAQRRIVLAGTAAGLGFVAYLLFDQARTMGAEGTLTTYLDWPEAPFVWGFAALAAVAALVAAVQFVAGAEPAKPESAGP